MSGSVVAAAMTGLTTLWAPVLPGFTVMYCSGMEPGPSFLAVGWDRADQPSVTFTTDTADASDIIGAVDVKVSSLLSVYLDTNDTSQPLMTLFAALDACDAALAANRTLSGAVMKAHIVEGDMTPYLGETGASVELRFTTRLTAFK